MKSTGIHVAAFIALQLAACDAQVKVEVYEGPKECEDVDKVKTGDLLSMHYTGTIDESSETGTKGEQFDSSRTRGNTFDFTIGQGEVIKGWDQGLLGLCKGAKAILVIPPDLGYGDRGAGGAIPGGATLKFDVEVVAIGEAPPPKNVFADLDTDKDGFLTVEEMLVHFSQYSDFKGELPPALMENEDKDKDGKVSVRRSPARPCVWRWVRHQPLTGSVLESRAQWEEFSGPKGAAPPGKDEL